VVDKLRKTGLWLFHNKERMFLFIMVGILCYRIYVVVIPEPPEQAPAVTAPSENVPAGTMPPVPEMRPPMDVPGNYTQLYNSNPFWYHAGKANQDKGEISAADLGITLLDIKKVGDRWRAQLRTTSEKDWYDEGEPFEEYELVRINPEQKTVIINAKRYRKRVTLSME
jgi:hypothetical protein